MSDTPPGPLGGAFYTATIGEQMRGHQLHRAGPTLMRCQCNTWQWIADHTLMPAYEEHLKDERRREEDLWKATEAPHTVPIWIRVAQFTATIAAFMGLVFVTLRFIG